MGVLATLSWRPVREGRRGMAPRGMIGLPV
jgi:hypothetical protein